jgi:hypothetical protein
LPGQKPTATRIAAAAAAATDQRAFFDWNMATNLLGRCRRMGGCVIGWVSRETPSANSVGTCASGRTAGWVESREIIESSPSFKALSWIARDVTALTSDRTACTRFFAKSGEGSSVDEASNLRTFASKVVIESR